MKIEILLLILATVTCEELIITKDYTEYLKRHVSWEVVDYEDNIFRGWTIDEARKLLGAKIPDDNEPLPIYESDKPLPSSWIWGADCIHEVRNQGSCGSCWTFGTAGMLSDRCCLNSGDHGWLAPQELVSCDKRNDGCMGGWPTWALQYVMDNKGLVHENCFPYKASAVECPTTCADSKDWKASHICNCYGMKQCLGVKSMKACITTGTVAVTFEVPQSFFGYKSGIYKCDGPSLGLHSVAATGYGDSPECHWIVRNSWGKGWGDKGYFKMACSSCGMNGKYVNGNAICETVK